MGGTEINNKTTVCSSAELDASGAMVNRSLRVALSLCVCLLGFANSVEVKGRLTEMKEQIMEIERVIQVWKAKIESQRESTFEVMSGNVARVKCIREHSLVPLHQLEYIEDYTENTNTRVKKSFANMAATIQELESRLEDVTAQVKFAEHFPFESEQWAF